MPTTINLKKKICLIGDAGVGKTSLIRKYVYDVFDDKYIATIGTKVTNKEIKFEKPDEDTVIYVKLMIWDILGQASFVSVKKSAFRGASGGLLVCDVTDNETLKHINDWANAFLAVAGDVPLVLLANKCDLISDTFDLEALKTVASGLGIPYYLTSAKTGKNVEESFFVLAELLITTPEPKKPKLPREPPPPEAPPKLTVHTVMDKIIDDFCTKHGGHEQAMPIIQHLFKKCGVDINNPKIDSLREVVDNLGTIAELYGTPEEAEAEKRKYHTLLDQLEQEIMIKMIEKYKKTEEEKEWIDKE